MKPLLRWIGLLSLALCVLELFFVGRIAAMVLIDPQSTTFQRSEAWRITHDKDGMRWHQQWVPYDQISDNLKRAVIASEDDSYTDHDGVDWEAVEKAWAKNSRAAELAEQRAAAGRKARAPKVVGGSTITQQLAKNLFLTGERTLLRKAQEFMLALVLEAVLDKRRILEIYLNNVEWGEGVFGAQAAAEHYFRKPATRLSAYEAARLAVMLPRPKYFEKLPASAYLAGRASTITARMPHARLP